MPQPSASSATSAVEPQDVLGSTGRAAFFIVLGLSNAVDADARVRAWCADVAAHRRSLRLRAPEGNVRCAVGFGSAAWDRLFGLPRPAALHPFQALAAGDRVAPSTPGDLFLHLRAESTDLCFELATQLLDALGDAVTPIDEVQGFRSFDARSMIGFVDGTENPVDQEAADAALVGEEDPDFEGGSYVLVQKYLHRMAAWNALSVEQQEQAIGRRKHNDVELSDELKPANAHNALTVITDDEGNELKIVRDNLPFGSPSRGEFGTYFIGYARDPAITERMLRNMVIGDPPGNYDRLLDFSEPTTGTEFFVPSATQLEALADRVAPGSPAAAPGTADGADAGDPSSAPQDGSLNIGSLKGEPSGPRLTV